MFQRFGLAGLIATLAFSTVATVAGLVLMRTNHNGHMETLAPSERLFRSADQCRRHFGKQERLACVEASDAADRLHFRDAPRFTSQEACEDATGAPCSSHPAQPSPRVFLPGMDGFVVGRQLDGSGRRAVFPVVLVNRPQPICTPGDARCVEPPPKAHPGAQHLRPGYYTKGVFIGDIAAGAKLASPSRSGTPFNVTVPGAGAIDQGLAVGVVFGAIRW